MFRVWKMTSIFEPPFAAEYSPLHATVQHNSQLKSISTSPRPLQNSSNLPQVTLPVAYHDNENRLREVDLNSIESLYDYIRWELNVSRLNAIHQHLWLTGRPMSARPLHRQLLLDRQIILTEQADLHMVWHESRIFLKPLPEFLLDHNFWKQHLCKDEQIFESASGMLLSYLWLVCHRSDLIVAKDHNLLPQDMDWERWTAFMKSCLRGLDYQTLKGINKRFQYGELRLSRLNWIYRMSWKNTRLTTIIRGYMYGYNRYSFFLARNFAWLLGAFAYITIVLTAMQVGLATDRLHDSPAFQAASYGFTVFSILIPLIGIPLICALLVIIFAYNLLATLSFGKKVEMERKKANTSRA